MKTLGLASLDRNIARQRSRIQHLAKVIPTRNSFTYKLVIGPVRMQFLGCVMAALLYCVKRRNVLQWTTTTRRSLALHNPRPQRLNFQYLGIPSKDLSHIDVCFLEEEIWTTIWDMPMDISSGPDGFTGLFYKTVWPVIKQDNIHAFNALWSLDKRSLYFLNDAYIILLKKKKVLRKSRITAP